MAQTEDPTDPPFDWQADPEHLARLQRLVERIVRLPRDRQKRVMSAILSLLEPTGPPTHP